MALTLTQMIGYCKEQREMFWKHLVGVRDEQWDWKPYPECKSIRETLSHMVLGGRATVDSLQNGRMPDWEAFHTTETDVARLTEQLNESFDSFLTYVEGRYADAPLDTPVFCWMSEMPVAIALASFANEDHYHSGQIAFIRQATDPSWDYYKEIFGLG